MPRRTPETESHPIVVAMAERAIKSYRVLAERLGKVSKQAPNKWVLGTNEPGGRTMARIQWVLGLTPLDIYPEEGAFLEERQRLDRERPHADAKRPNGSTS